MLPYDFSLNTMPQKLRVGILCGGKSAEHEISLLSAKSITQALSKQKYDPVILGIDTQGKWYRIDTKDLLALPNDAKKITLPETKKEIVIIPGNEKKSISSPSGDLMCDNIDIIFPILHGTNGEDGSMQGLLQLLDIPFVGPNTLGSAVGMDKDICKRLLRDSKIPVSKWQTLRIDENIPYRELENYLGYPVFVKPANAGSSVGVRKAKNRAELAESISHAFLFDHKILIEECIIGKEIECGVLGNIGNMKASTLGEVIPTHEFYSYEAKYIDENGAGTEIPANISSQATETIQKMAIKVCQTLECEGMSRVDFFLTKDEQIYINEINTLPGFTKISMYPKLWEHAGLSYPDLIDTLLLLAIERHKKKKSLSTKMNNS